MIFLYKQNIEKKKTLWGHVPIEDAYTTTGTEGGWTVGPPSEVRDKSLSAFAHNTAGMCTQQTHLATCDEFISLQVWQRDVKWLHFSPRLTARENLSCPVRSVSANRKA